jgi:hypothetical protein
LLLIYLVVFGGFACLFPLAFYCLVLANLNNRRRPTLVPGPADFTGVLLATAGFLIVGGPLVLSGLHENWRRLMVRGSFADIRAALAEAEWPWLVAWAGYFVLVVGGAAWLLRRRRAASVVYNIDSTAGQKLIADLLDRLDLPWTRREGVYSIGFDTPPRRTTTAPEGVPVGQAVLALTAAPALRHLTLHWLYDSGTVRRRFESELRDALGAMETPDSPVAGWFLTAATALFSVLLVLLGLLVMVLWQLRA